ncbi:MAG: hypothetical protein ABFS18_02785 [Thermodesulfobacteriota bacterium]
MTDKDDLFKGIEEAANSLFDQYKVTKTETTSSDTTPTPAESPTSTAAAPPELELEIEEKPAVKTTPAPSKPKTQPAPPKPKAQPAPPKPKAQPAPPQPKIQPAPQIPEDGEHIFNELEETLLTIDWEVNQDNIAKGRDVLSQLIAAHGWVTTSPVGQVAATMDKVLASMFKSPENSPTSAPSQLKNAFLAIRESTTGSKSSEGSSDIVLSTALSNLQALLDPKISSAGFPSQNLSDDLQAATPVESIPQPVEEPSFDLGLEMSVEEPAAEQAFDLGLEMSVEEPADELSSPSETVADATVKVLKSYNTLIGKALKLISPMENLFASRPDMAKLHTASKRLTASLTSQQKLLSGTFSSDYSSYDGLGTLNSWLESQLEVLKGCVRRISKMEKLFAKTAGYEKLFTRSKQIRQTLENQVDAITVAVGGTPSQHQFDLTGEYPAVIQPVTPQVEEAPAAAVSAVASPEAIVDQCIDLAKAIEDNTTDSPQTTGLQIHKTLVKLKTALSGAAIHSPGAAAAAANAAGSAAAHNTKCRWDWLLKTSWGGQLVGIAPEQVVFESKSAFPANAFKDLTFFSLKKLKSMPWTNLQGLFSGELAEYDKSALSNMELEIARPPASFPGSSKKKVYMVILFSEGSGKVYLVDSATEAISVAEEALWVPGSSPQSDIAGTLTVYGSTMPIVSID